MPMFLVGIASKGNEIWTKNLEKLVLADDKDAAEAKVQESLAENDGYHLGVNNWYITSVKEMEPGEYKIWFGDC